MKGNQDTDLRRLRGQAEDLLEQIRRLAADEPKQPVTDAPPSPGARGTGDTTAAAAAAVASTAAAEPPLPDRIIAALRARPTSIEDLARAVGSSVGRVSSALRPMRKRLWNAGTETEPRWFLPPAKDVSPEAFAAAVQALIRVRPMTTPELVRATGTEGTKRVWHALLRLNDAPGSRIVRQGDARHPVWFWLDESVDVSRFHVRSSAR